GRLMMGFQHSRTRHVPDLLELRARIADHLGNRAEAMQIGLYLLHLGLARIRCHIDQKTDFGNGTSISSSNCVRRRSRVDSALIVMALNSTPCFFAHLWLMTSVQAISAATSVSVGVGPMLVPSRSLGSSMTALTSRTEISVREWVRQLPRIRYVT